MKNLKKSHLILIGVSVLILLGCIGMTAYLLFSNYQTVRLFKQARDNFQRGDADSLELAEAQLLQVIRRDSDNEAAFIMLGKIAGKQKIYPEQVYYYHMAYRLNPLSLENKELYAASLCAARYFDRLEIFLSQQPELGEKFDGIRIYAAGRNGNINKYKVRYNADKPFYHLAFLLFKDRQSSPAEKLTELQKISGTEAFLQQELIAARAELHLANGDLDKTEADLLQAYELNQYAFAPALGRFYANYRNFGKALQVFETYLKIYHDPAVAMQTAEIYCLLNRTEEIARLRTQYQADAGNAAMLCCYYFDALTALAKNEMAALKELTVPLRKNINTPLAAFMFFCADVYENDPAAVLESYTALVAHRSYLDLQRRADGMVSELLKRSLTAPAQSKEPLFALAKMLYGRQPEAFTAKFILLVQKQRNSIDAALLKDAQARFSNDPGVAKIAIEYYLTRDLTVADGLIAAFRKKFPAQKNDMLRYEIILALRSRNYDRASQLFMDNFSAELAPEYWRFASTVLREKDLQFLSRDPGYAPFCQAQLCLKKGDRKTACRLLETADAHGNWELLFFAAKTLGENSRHQAALKKYAMFPANSPYQLAVLLNTAEIYAETGEFIPALDSARRAYNIAPELPEAQLCYADKLLKSGNVDKIPDVVKISSPRYRQELTKLWIAGMEARIKAGDVQKSPVKLRNLCEELLRIDKHNPTAISYYNKINRMLWDKLSPQQQKINSRE